MYPSFWFSAVAQVRLVAPLVADGLFHCQQCPSAAGPLPQVGSNVNTIAPPYLSPLSRFRPQQQSPVIALFDFPLDFKALLRAQEPGARSLLHPFFPFPSFSPDFGRGIVSINTFRGAFLDFVPQVSSA